MTTALLRSRGYTETSVAAGERRVTSGGRLYKSPPAASSGEVLPAAYGSYEDAYPPSWLSSVRQRILDLAERDDGWDSYDGLSLQDGALAAYAFILEYHSVIQTPPALSLTPEGGLACEWVNEQATMEVVSFLDGSLHFYYLDVASGREQEGRVAEVQSAPIEKWLWRASRRPDVA